ncbi:RDD family protein [Actinomadura rugatobispora]|uniref:RDD family protein n=1 Tax=Actinomadura rugatobispora TaxID=1994 RepID=A0ABW1AJS9_9ACTN|nr:hypothetical protein GCM10010200_031670 [Actinomadura rugatobispora]
MAAADQSPKADPLPDEGPPDEGPLPEVVPGLAEPGQRLLARIVDTLVVGLPVVAVVREVVPAADFDVVAPPAVAGFLLLYEWIQLSLWGRTLGKRFAGIEVVRFPVPEGAAAPADGALGASQSVSEVAEGPWVGSGLPGVRSAALAASGGVPGAPGPVTARRDVESAPEPSIAAEGEGAEEAEGVREGVREGAVEGGVEGTVEGASERVRQADREGAAEGVAEGAPEDGWEHAAEGFREGGHEDVLEDVPERVPEGAVEGAPVAAAEVALGDASENGSVPEEELQKPPRLGVARSLLRSATYALPIAVRPVPVFGLIAGVFWVGNAGLMYEGVRRQALHDRLAATVVVKRGAA